MEDYVLINSVGRVDHLRSLIRQDLRDVGIKLPKSKKLKKLNQSRTGSRDDLRSNIFGEHLCNLPSEFLKDHGYVPQFLIDASKVINSHLNCEGIFRKSGSVSRQKELRQAVDTGGVMDNANIYDVTVLVKQFFRDLPEPIFTTLYHEAFLKCYQLPAEKDPVQALLQLCLCLPLENIGALRFTLQLLETVASHAEKNKMNASNLALVLAPNFLHSNKGTQKMSSTEEKHLHMEASIMEILIKNCKLVGLVNTTLQKQVGLMSECFGTDDELDVSDDNMLENSKSRNPKKKRRRSGSLTGLVSSIASGFAKLRRSTDGRNMNASSSSTFPGELSIASNTSMAPDQTLDASAMTPCVMRKRRASGDTVPFSANKKKAILGGLPQRSALGSTPFTPASTVKRNVFNDSHYVDDNPQLNATTPCQGTKASRKKLNLFTSPGSNKKVKRQSSLAKLASPNLKDSKSKGKNFFRRLSGSRNEKEEDNLLFSSKQGRTRLGSVDSTSPKSTASDSAISDFASEGISRSASSPSMHDTDVFTEPYNGGTSSNTSINPALSDLERLRKRPPKSIDKSEIGLPHPVIVPVVTHAKDASGTTPYRRSRREEFEQENQAKRKGKMAVAADMGALDKSVCSQLDMSLMGAVLPPPSGFGDQTLLEEPVNVDDISMQDPLSALTKASSSSSASSSVTAMINGKSSSEVYRNVQQCTLSRNNAGSSKLSDETFIDVGGVEDMYVSLRPPKSHAQEGDYVVLRKYSVGEEASQASSQGGIDMLRENYRSEEDSSSSVSESHSGHLDSDLDELISIPSKPNIHRKKSLSAQDLQRSPKICLPTRSQSQYISPCKKFNYKPHLEISKETHRILTKAGYLNVNDKLLAGKDIQVPVKSPKRSAYREEMKQSLRYSFHERHNRTNRSVMSKSSLSNFSVDSFNSSLNSLEQSSLHDSQKLGDKSLTSTAERSEAHTRDGDPVEVPASDDGKSCQKTDTRFASFSFKCNVGEASEGQENGTTGNAISTDFMEEHKKCNRVLEEDTESLSSLNTAPKEPHSSAVAQHDSKLTKLSIKDCDRSLTLSGFLDKEIKRDIPPVKIKRAEVKMPSHDSVSNLKVFQAGIVAESVKQFSHPEPSILSQTKKITFPSNKKRGTSPVRIPTIFAKSGESLKHYQEIAQFVRERTGTVPSTQSSSLCQSRTPSPPSNDSSNPELRRSQDSLSENETAEMETDSPEYVHKQNGESDERSESLMKSGSGHQPPVGLTMTDPVDTSDMDKELIKSPLQESTNTAPSSVISSSAAADGIKLYTSAGLTPKRLLLKSDAGLANRSNPRPLKRLKGQRSPRRAARVCKSPNRRAHTEASLGEGDARVSDRKLVSVAISFDDEEPGTSGS